MSTMKAPTKCPSFVILATYLILVSNFGQIEAENTQVVKSFLRDKVNAFGYARFIKHENTMLNLTAISKGFLNNVGQCAYICANSSNGFSFNFVTTPDIYGRHVCEIFATDKYRRQDSFICKPGVNHYSVAVSSLVVCFGGVWHSSARDVGESQNGDKTHIFLTFV